jgi:electron transport complex protein RnfB
VPVSADAIDALLPQTQCTRCGYEACKPYAEAIAQGDAAHNRCPPGGATTITALSDLLGIVPLPLDPECGEESPVARVARVVEADCIGCTKCIQACPVDAIVGAANLMHTVIAEQCTGCELCIPPCPVDCIEMNDAPTLPLPKARNAEFRALYVLRNERLERLSNEEAERRRRLRPADDPVAAALARLRR